MTRGAPEMHSPFSENALKAIFKVRAGNPSVIVSRENNRLEFRETFGLSACKDKLRTFAAFANNQGGYLETQPESPPFRRQTRRVPG